jgi:hypothetical protein
VYEGTNRNSNNTAVLAGIVKGELNALFAGDGINGSYIDQLTLLLISVIKKHTSEVRMSLFSTSIPSLKSLNCTPE